MTARYVLYLNAHGAIALCRKRRGNVVLGRFGRAADGETPPEGAEALFADTAGERWVFIVDSVDEELHVEDMPRLRAADRQRMMVRRAAQRFRDKRLSTWLPLGRDGGWRRSLARQQVLLAGLAVDDDLRAWTSLAEAHGIRLAAIRSPALLVTGVVRGLGAAPSGLLVTIQPAGIRQTLLVDGQPRFTRLAVVAEARIDAAAVVREVSRVMHYLLMNQIVARDRMRDGDLVVWVVTDGVAGPDLLPQELAVDNSSVVGLQAVSAAALGAAAVVDEAGRWLPADDPGAGLGVWTQRAVLAAGAGDYASRAMRAVDRQVALRRAVVAMGSSALAASLLAWVGVMAVHGADAQAGRPVLSRAEVAELARLEAASAKMPVAGGEMARVVAAERKLREQAFAPRPLLQAVARVLTEAVDVRLVSLSWSRPAAGDAQAGDGRDVAGNGLPGLGSGNGLPGIADDAEALSSAGSEPAGAANSGTGAADAAWPARAGLRVLIRAELPAHLAKSAANARAGAIAGALGLACRCTAVLREAPFDAEPSTGYSTRPAGEDEIGLRFIVELRPDAPVAGDTFAGRAAPRS